MFSIYVAKIRFFIQLPKLIAQNFVFRSNCTIFAAWKDKPSRATICGTVARAGHVWPAFLVWEMGLQGCNIYNSNLGPSYYLPFEQSRNPWQLNFCQVHLRRRCYWYGDWHSVWWVWRRLSIAPCWVVCRNFRHTVKLGVVIKAIKDYGIGERWSGRCRS